MSARALTLGLVALIIVSPSLIYAIYIFRPSSSHVITLVNDLLVHFRLITGAPIFIDFKSVPYRDTDVLEWFERVRMAGWFYRDRVEYVNCDLLRRFREEYTVTHVVLDEDLLGLSCPGLGEEMFRDEHYAVFRIDA